MLRPVKRWFVYSIHPEKVLRNGELCTLKKDFGDFKSEKEALAHYEKLFQLHGTADMQEIVCDGNKL